MKLKEGFVVREVGGKKYAVATGEAARSFKGMLSLNEVGTVIFLMLQEGATEKDIVKRIRAEYDVEEDVVAADLNNFIRQLESIDVLEG